MDTQAKRVLRAVTAVLPVGAEVAVEKQDGPVVSLRVWPTRAGERRNPRNPRTPRNPRPKSPATRIRAIWVGEGWLGDVTDALANRADQLDLLVARRISPGAAERASQAGIGWVDETGAAELTVPGLVLARSGQEVRLSKRVSSSRTPRNGKPSQPNRPIQPSDPSQPGWPPSVIAAAEALLTGTRPTVASVHKRTGLSVGAVNNALATLTELGHLQAATARGRNSARNLADPERLLFAYAAAVNAEPPRPTIRVGVVGDVMSELSDLGKQLGAQSVGWALTGVAAAAVLAPYLSDVNAADVFVDASTPAELEAIARRSGLQILEGGRVRFRPFSSAVSDRLSTSLGDMRVAPWPRVFADLRVTGVRGEEAAEHLREVMANA